MRISGIHTARRENAWPEENVYVANEENPLDTRRDGSERENTVTVKWKYLIFLMRYICCNLFYCETEVYVYVATEENYLDEK